MLEKGKAENPQTGHSLTEGKALGSSLICLKCQNAVRQTPPEIWLSGGSLAGLESAVSESTRMSDLPLAMVHGPPESGSPGEGCRSGERACPRELGPHLSPPPQTGNS